MSLHYATLPAHSWDAWLAAWLPRLPETKRVAIERRREPADRIASVLGIALLGTACGTRGIAFDPAALEYPARGKPRLRGAPAFSIAHAGGLVACALAAQEAGVGLDLEPRGAVRPDQLRLVLDPDEFEAVASGRVGATDAWVMKEAVLKAAGRGADAARRVTLHGRTALYDGTRYALVRADLAATHVAWLAVPGEAPAVEAVEHDPARVLALPAAA